MPVAEVSIDDHALDQIFRTARSFNGWLDRPLSDGMLQEIYDIAKFGPTSANACPARFVFLRTQEAKERLKPHLIPDNVEKVMTAPAVAIVAYDLAFYDKIPELFPHNPGAKSWFEGNGPLIQETAFRNGSLQGAYLMIAARACGIDCGPMSGFDRAGVDQEFFKGTSWASNFLCGLGYGDPTSIFPRSPRLDFADACTII